MKYLNILSFYILLILLFSGCIYGAGTLGGFDPHVFYASKQSVVKGIDSLYSNNPESSMPEKWVKYDGWSVRGYGFLDSRIFYFQSEPEEMYYVSFIGDSNKANPKNNNRTELSIRAVFKELSGWKYERELSSSEKKRIIKRFNDEIIIPIENYIEENN